MNNLLTELPENLTGEVFQTIIENKGVKIERITSLGQVTPAGEWYDQPQNEWVLLLQGRARLAFEDGREQSLQPGDHAWLPAHCRHRVSWTDPDQPTLWLAVHWPRPE
ncbi:cupin domain-containing protein [Ferrimonas sediminicola]|uniref:Cupin domain-containing protein n=1 Tax=Ferrimonas sediminicola TaxID=2569538 RepID=A0A4U1BBN5_9GAMM|nr:cupin domain-containing protein [Ferrimonas sediminicola]TKB48330.1 cupin domain-containing protein [Ferrimonas sediminicola]